MDSRLRAARGDWIVIERAGIGQPARKGLIVGVRSVDGSPPYLVRWAGHGHTSLMFPGPDARVVSARAARRPALRLSSRLSRIWRLLKRGRQG